MGIWNWQNMKVLSKKKSNTQHVFESTLTLLANYKKAQVKVTQQKPTKECKWESPTMGSFKINFEASFCAEKKTAGVEVVVRD